MTPELRDRLLGSAGLSDDLHVRLQPYDRAQSFTNDRVILDAQNTDGRLSHGPHASMVIVILSQNASWRTARARCRTDGHGPGGTPRVRELSPESRFRSSMSSRSSISHRS